MGVYAHAAAHYIIALPRRGTRGAATIQNIR